MMELLESQTVEDRVGGLGGSNSTPVTGQESWAVGCPRVTLGVKDH